MEQEKSAIEILKEFAKRTGRKIEVSEKKYPLVGIRPRHLHRNHIIISSSINPSVFFISFNDDKGFGDNAMYSGVFFPISAPVSSIIKIRKKNILDKLNPFLKKREYRGVSYKFASKVVIEVNDLNTITKVFSTSKIQDLIIKALNLDERLRVGINNIEIDMMPDFKSKSLFGIYISPQWLLNETVIDELFLLAEEIYRSKTQ